MDYQEAATLQEHIRNLRLQEAIPDTVLFVEHYPVFTLGRRSDKSEFPLSAEWCKDHNIAVYETRRGGKVTFHNPGQLVVYPILYTADVIAYVRSLEEIIIASLANVGIQAVTRSGSDYTGVWVQDRKIASIGIHLAKQVTTHGFAINVANDLEPFQWITACGLPDVRMTSVKQELALSQAQAKTLISDMKGAIVQEFCQHYHVTATQVSAESFKNLRTKIQ